MWITHYILWMPFVGEDQPGGRDPNRCIVLVLVCLWEGSLPTVVLLLPQKHLIIPITASIRYFSAYIRHWDEPCRAPHITKYRVNFMSNASAALNPQI